MTRAPAKVTQADIARAIRAIEQTGARMAVEISDGIIRLVPVDSVRDGDRAVDQEPEIVL